MLSTWLPLLLSAAFALLAPRVADRLPPAVATILLTVGSFAVAATSLASIAVIAARLVAQIPAVAARKHLSSAVLDRHDHDAASIAVVVLALLLVPFAVRAVRRLWLDTAATCRLALVFADLPPGLTVVSDLRPQAFAVPPIPRLAAPRIVVTDSLLRTLEPSQRRAVLAHEHAHLQRRHYLYILATNVAAAVYPVLSHLPEAVTHATERWADEDAARALGDRRAVAVALGRAALATDARVPRAVPAMAQAHVAERVRALLAPPPQQRRALTATIAAVLAVAALASLHSLHETDQLFDAARLAWTQAHGT